MCLHSSPRLNVSHEAGASLRRWEEDDLKKKRHFISRSLFVVKSYASMSQPREKRYF